MESAGATRGTASAVYWPLEAGNLARGMKKTGGDGDFKRSDALEGLAKHE